MGSQSASLIWCFTRARGPRTGTAISRISTCIPPPAVVMSPWLCSTPCSPRPGRGAAPGPTGTPSSSTAPPGRFTTPSAGSPRWWSTMLHSAAAVLLEPSSKRLRRHHDRTEREGLVGQPAVGGDHPHLGAVGELSKPANDLVVGRVRLGPRGVRDLDHR